MFLQILVCNKLEITKNLWVKFEFGSYKRHFKLIFEFPANPRYYININLIPNLITMFFTGLI